MCERGIFAVLATTAERDEADLGNLTKTLGLLSLLGLFFVYEVRAANDHAPLSARELEDLCQNYLFSFEDRRVQESGEERLSESELNQVQLESNDFTEEEIRESARELGMEDAPDEILFRTFEAGITSANPRMDLVGRYALHVLQMEALGRADTDDVADLLARKWFRIYVSSFLNEHNRDTAVAVFRFLMEHAKLYQIASLGENYQKGLTPRTYDFDRHSFLSMTEHLILSVSFKHRVHLYADYQSPGIPRDAFEAFSLVRNRYGTRGYPQGTLSYTEARSKASQLTGMFNFLRGRMMKGSIERLSSIDPLTDELSEVRKEIRSELKYLELTGPRFKGMRSTQKLPLLIYADYLAQASSLDRLYANPENARALVESLRSNEFKAPLNESDLLGFVHLHRDFFQAVFSWEELIEDSASMHDQRFVPTHDDILPFAKKTDREVFEFLAMTTQSRLVLGFCKRILFKDRAASP